MPHGDDDAIQRGPHRRYGCVDAFVMFRPLVSWAAQWLKVQPAPRQRASQSLAWVGSHQA